MQADVLGVPVQRAAVRETTALGAAYLAGLATGVWRDTAALAALWRSDRPFSPSLDARPARRATPAGGAPWPRPVTRVSAASDWPPYSGGRGYGACPYPLNGVRAWPGAGDAPTGGVGVYKVRPKRWPKVLASKAAWPRAGEKLPAGGGGSWA